MYILTCRHAYIELVQGVIEMSILSVSGTNTWWLHAETTYLHVIARRRQSWYIITEIFNARVCGKCGL